MPEGIPLVEIVGDLGRVLKLAETVNDPRLPKLLEALGVDTLGAVAIRSRLNSRSNRSRMISRWSRPRKPQRKPKPSAADVSVS